MMLYFLFFFLLNRHPPRSTLTDTLFPSTPLFRSLAVGPATTRPEKPSCPCPEALPVMARQDTDCPRLGKPHGPCIDTDRGRQPARPDPHPRTRGHPARRGRRCRARRLARPPRGRPALRRPRPDARPRSPSRGFGGRRPRRRPPHHRNSGVAGQKVAG